jgi:hypothetical protein
MRSNGSGGNEARSSLSHSAAYQSRFMKLPSHTFNSGLMYASSRDIKMCTIISRFPRMKDFFLSFHSGMSYWHLFSQNAEVKTEDLLLKSE